MDKRKTKQNKKKLILCIHKYIERKQIKQAKKNFVKITR